MTNNVTVGFISLGCAKNQINTEIMIAAVKNAGFKITGDISKCDVAVINTCGFIEDAKREALDVIFETVQLKKEGVLKKIIACGCLTQRYASEIATELYEVDGFLGVGSFDKIVDAITDVINDNRPMHFDSLKNIQLDGERVLTTPNYSAYIKVADGCSNRCAYCAIPIIRGDFKSRTIENILQEANTLAKDGAKELIVIAQDTTNYGTDIYGDKKLAELLKSICKIDGIEWVRVMYLYPDKITDELIDVIKTEPKIVKYIEMPIQHASGNVLKSMNRPGDENSLLALVKKLRKEIPNVVLRTTVMVGFPTETESDFETLCEFIKAAEFDKLGVFEFSPEIDTPAYDMEQIPDDIKKSRAETVELIQSSIVERKQSALMGKILLVLCEGYDRYGECYFGRSYMEAPDIDGKIFFTSSKKIAEGELVNVKLTECIDFEIIGELVE